MHMNLDSGKVYKVPFSEAFDLVRTIGLSTEPQEGHEDRSKGPIPHAYETSNDVPLPVFLSLDDNYSRQFESASGVRNVPLTRMYCFFKQQH